MDTIKKKRSAGVSGPCYDEAFLLPNGSSNSDAELLTSESL